MIVKWHLNPLFLSMSTFFFKTKHARHSNFLWKFSSRIYRVSTWIVKKSTLHLEVLVLKWIICYKNSLTHWSVMLQWFDHNVNPRNQNNTRFIDRFLLSSLISLEVSQQLLNLVSGTNIHCRAISFLGLMFLILHKHFNPSKIKWYILEYLGKVYRTRIWKLIQLDILYLN